jgi:nucleotide-binding universal stress UspA family protein
VINRILVATDASAASNRALEMAAQFAVLNDAEMLIIHVIRDMQIPFEIDEIPELEFHQIESFNDARAIGTGDPATSILGFAERSETEMIVMGTRGLGKLKGTILGSVSRKVADNAETSCLIVR